MAHSRQIVVGLAAAAWPVTLLAAVQDPTPPKTPTAWILGAPEPVVGEVFEAWFDRGALGPLVRHPVTIGSPGPITVWLRGSGETCAATQSAARRVTTTVDGSMLYVCALPHARGKVHLAAAAGAPALVVSDPIAVTSRYVLGPTGASLLTAAVGFISGLLTSFITSAVQNSRQRKREREAVEQQAQATLAKALSAEILANARAIDVFLNSGGDPVTLELAAFNSSDQASELAWGYLQRPVLTSYRERLAALYRDHIPPYQRAVVAWRDAPADKKAAALAEVRARATELQRHFHNT